MKDLTNGKITKVILQFTLPILIGNLFNLAYNLADTRIIGSYLGNDALAAVGSISTYSDLIVGLIVGIANGFAVVIARYFGMGNREKVRRTFSLALMLGIMIAALLMTASLLGLNQIMNVLNVMEVHRANSQGYISIILYGLIFSIIYNILASSLRAIGDAYTPLLFLILSACMNVGLDILCVGVWNMGVEGAALATVVSQFIAAVLCFAYTWIKYPMLHFSFKDFLPSREYTDQLIPAGFSMGMMSCLVSIGTVALQTAINTLGTNTIVAHAATRKLTNLYMLPFGTLGAAMATFAGQNFGAGKINRIKKGIKSSLFIAYAWCILVLVMSYTICPYLIIAITDTSIREVIQTACLYQRVDTLVYMLVPTITVLRNSLQGMGDHKTPIISSSLELAGKMAFAFALTPIFGYWAIILAEPVVWAIMVIPLIFSMIKRLRAAN